MVTERYKRLARRELRWSTDPDPVPPNYHVSTKLTYKDILALKNADVVKIQLLVMNTDKTKYNLVLVTCYKKQLEKCLSWDLLGTGAVQYLAGIKLEGYYPVTYIIQANNDFIWQTFTGHIVTGDTLDFVWMPDALTELSWLDHDLHGDLLRCIVFRSGKQFHFHVAAHIGAGQRWADWPDYGLGEALTDLETVQEDFVGGIDKEFLQPTTDNLDTIVRKINFQRRYV